MIDALLVSHLQHDPAIASLVSYQSEDETLFRISVGDVPADDEGSPIVATYIWLSLFQEEPILDLDGKSGLSRFNFDVECCSTDPNEAKRLGRLVHKRLQGFQGYFQVDGIQSPTRDEREFIQGVFVEGKDDEYEKQNTFGEADITIVALEVQCVANDEIEDLETA